jgi:hypothetical protein
MPPDGSALYAASGSSDAKLYRTTDFGASWQTLSSLPTGNFIDDLVIDPVNPDTLYALVELTGLFKSIDRGQSWTLLNPLTGFAAKKLAIDPGAPMQMLLATYNGQLQISADGGAHWALDVSAPLTGYVWVGYVPSAPGAANGAAVAIPAIGRVIHRTSRTQSWISGAQVKLGNVPDAAFDPTNTDPNNSTLLVATSEGPLLSGDSGMTFAVRSQGMRTLAVTNLAAARDAQGTVYASISSGPMGVYRRTLSGWSAVDNAELRGDLTGVFQPVALAADPVDPQAMIMSAAYSLMNSFDGGQSWTGPNFDFYNVLVTSVQFAPSNPLVAYLGTYTDGVYRSDTHGLTWLKRSTGLPSAISFVAVDPTTSATAYAAVRPPAAALVFKTTDSGASWTPAGSGLSADAITSLVIDPVNPQILYASGGGNAQGVFKSTNAGQSWARVGAPAANEAGWTIAIDPIVSSTLFMTMNSFGEASRSVDGGATWERLPSPPPNSLVLNPIVLDPLKPSNLIAGTGGYGLLEIEVAPDLSVSFASVPPNVIALGGSAGASLRVTNRGPFAASAVVLTISPPVGTTMPLPSPGQGTCAAVTNGFRCVLGALSTNQQVDVPLTLNAGGGVVQSTLSAVVAAHESDPAPNDNSVSAPVAVTRIADLGVVLAPSAAALDHHATLTLTATATNAGPNPSAATQVVIDLGTAFGYQGATPSKGSCTQNGPTVTCALGALDPATSATVAVAVTADSIGAAAASAQISDAGLQDPTGTNNSSTANVTSRAVADLGVTLTDSADPVASGQAFAYTATITNSGPDDVVASTVTVSVAGATVTGATTPQGNCTTGGATATCTLNTIANGANTTVALTATAGAAGTATASAAVAFAGTDKVASNDSVTQPTTVSVPPSLANNGGGGGGGGGAFGEVELLALLALVIGRRRLRLA